MQRFWVRSALILFSTCFIFSAQAAMAAGDGLGDGLECDIDESDRECFDEAATDAECQKGEYFVYESTCSSADVSSSVCPGATLWSCKCSITCYRRGSYPDSIEVDQTDLLELAPTTITKSLRSGVLTSMEPR